MRNWLVLLFFMLAPQAVWATAQIPEMIKLDGKLQPLFSEPFTVYLAARQSEIPKLEQFATDRCSGSWRGYQGHWYIRDQKLYLKELFANPCRESPEPIPLTTFFPNIDGPVFAEWFSGRLIVPLGKRIRYVHMGYESEYERYLVFTVERGRVSNQESTDTRPK